MVLLLSVELQTVEFAVMCFTVFHWLSSRLERGGDRSFESLPVSVWFVIQFTRDTAKSITAPIIMYLYIVCALTYMYMYVKFAYMYSIPCAMKAKEAMDLESWTGGQVGPDCKLHCIIKDVALVLYGL